MGVFNKLELPCIHLGAPTGEVRDCVVCGAQRTVPVFACAKYGRCSPGDRLVYREEDRNVEVQWCRTCPSYENPLVPVAAPAPALSGVAHPSMLVPEKMHLYRRNPDGSVPMETYSPGAKATRPDGSEHWLAPPLQRPAVMTMAEARAAGLSPLGSGPGTDPNCNGCSCGGTGIQTTCCSPPVPSTLTLTLTDNGSCSCLAGTFTMTFNTTFSQWQTDFTAGTTCGSAGGSSQWTLTCQSSNNLFLLTIADGVFTTSATMTTDSCGPPIHLTVSTFTPGSNWCTGSVKAVVTP